MTRALRLRLLPLAWLLACVACGGASPAPAEPTAAPAANGEEAGPDEPGASAAPSEAATEPGSAPPAALRELLAAERVPRDEWVGAMPSPTEAIADCPAWEHEGEPDEYWFEECGLRETLGRTAAGWLALEIDWDERGVFALRLVEGDASAARERVGGAMSPALVERLRGAIAGSEVRAVRDRVGRVVPETFSITGYAPLVELEGTDWLLWLETRDALDRPEWVLWLVSPDGRTRRELGRREATRGPCDGGGYWCEETNAECDEEGLRAEGRLCVLPLGIRRVAIDGEAMAVLGTIAVAGHGGAPGRSWFVDAPGL